LLKDSLIKNVNIIKLYFRVARYHHIAIYQLIFRNTNTLVRFEVIITVSFNLLTSTYCKFAI